MCSSVSSLRARSRRSRRSPSSEFEIAGRMLRYGISSPSTVALRPASSSAIFSCSSFTKFPRYSSQANFHSSRVFREPSTEAPIASAVSSFVSSTCRA